MRRVTCAAHSIHLTRRLRPDSVVPLALFLAEQDANGVTGESFNVLRWNQENELGGFEAWGSGPDVEAARAAGTLYYTTH